MLTRKQKGTDKMASCGGLPQLGGYQYEFLNPVPDKWTCPICHLALKDPAQLLGCGHRFCELCIGSVLR